ncbi:MAG: FBP domain-containing protein [Polyangia bacterium]
MTAIASERQLVRCFREIDQAEVALPKQVQYPLDVTDVFAWSEGPRTFLLFRATADGLPRGVVFHRSTGATPDVAAMCEWCYAVRSHGGVKLLTVSTDDRHRVGLYLCSGLSCLDHARKPPGPDDIQEGLDSEQRVRRTLARIVSFAERRLGE